MAPIFAGKRALVTGAGKGIGRAAALRLASHGAEVFALSRTQADLDSLKAENPKIQTACVDLTDWSSTKEIVSKMIPISLLVNNAATAVQSSVLNLSSEGFDTMMAVNVKSALNISQVIATDLINRNQKGNIVNVSSVGSLRATQSGFGYSSSKAALDMLTKCMAYELSSKGIRVNSINPTLVWTAMSRKIFTEELGQKFANKLPMRRLATVDDVVNSIMFLLSDKSDMVNGHLLPIDGGQMCC